MKSTPTPLATAWLTLLCGLSACSPTRLDMFPLGGAWHMYRHQHLPEAGSTPTDLYREWKGARVLVERDVEFDEYYKVPDCLLWETKSAEHVVFAACGEHEPLVIARDDYHRWTMAPGGLMDEYEPHVNGQGAPVRPGVMISIEAIAAASARRPAFSAAWTPESTRSGDGLRPVELDVPSDSLRPVEVDLPIDVTTRNAAGRPPLMLAASERGESPASRLALVNALIEHGADVNATDPMGATALMVASEKGHVEVMTRLIAAGSTVDAQSRDGYTALMQAAQALNNTIESVTVLLQAGADKSIRDMYGKTAVNKIRSNTDPKLRQLLQ